jgi:hypothetical protein
MKKRSFLLPLAVSLTALVASTGMTNAKPVTPTNVSPTTEVSALSTPTPAKPLVLKRAKSLSSAQYAEHYSHRSHSSHSSHRSHYSSR